MRERRFDLEYHVDYDIYKRRLAGDNYRYTLGGWKSGVKKEENMTRHKGLGTNYEGEHVAFLGRLEDEHNYQTSISWVLDLQTTNFCVDTVTLLVNSHQSNGGKVEWTLSGETDGSSIVKETNILPGIVLNETEKMRAN